MNLWSGMRDYKNFPLKNREIIPKDDLYELYIIQNFSAEEIGELLNISKHKVNNCAAKYKFKKSKEQHNEARKRLALKKFGNSCYLQTKDGKVKTQKTLLERYGKDGLSNEEIINKRRKTCLEKYGVDNPSKSKIVKDKRRNTCLNKYSVASVTMATEIKNKIKQSVKSKYNVDNVSQMKKVKEKKKKTFNLNYDTEDKKQNIIDKRKQTNLEKFGAKTFAESTYCNWEEQQEKRYLTMKKNNSFNTSKDEKAIKQMLLKKFNTVLTEYKSNEYPFKCDFYIPKLNLYIEYQGHISHGKRPFDEHNHEDIKLLETWKTRSQEINFKGEIKDSYRIFIDTWTIRDVKKRKWAKENNLNWIEFFSLDEFMSWYNIIK